MRRQKRTEAQENKLSFLRVFRSLLVQAGNLTTEKIRCLSDFVAISIRCKQQIGLTIRKHDREDEVSFLQVFRRNLNIGIEWSFK